MLALYVKAKTLAWRLRNREDGQGMVEYGLIIALVAIGLILVVTTMREELVQTFTKITGELDKANNVATSSGP